MIAVLIMIMTITAVVMHTLAMGFVTVTLTAMRLVIAVPTCL